MFKKLDLEKISYSFSLVLFLVLIFSFLKSTEYFTDRKCNVEYGTCISECLKETDKEKKQDCYINCTKEKDQCELGDIKKPLFQGSMGSRILTKKQANDAFKQQVTGEATLVGNNKVCWGEKCITVDNSSENNESSQTGQSGQGSQTGQSGQGSHSNHDKIKNELNKCNQKLNLMKQLLLIENN